MLGYTVSVFLFFGREFTLLCKYDQLEFLKGEGSDPQPFSLDPRMLYRMSKSAFSELEAYFCLHYQRNNYFLISNNWFSRLFDDNVILNLTYCAYSIQKKIQITSDVTYSLNTFRLKFESATVVITKTYLLVVCFKQEKVLISISMVHLESSKKFSVRQIGNLRFTVTVKHITNLILSLKTGVLFFYNVSLISSLSCNQ